MTPDLIAFMHACINKEEQEARDVLAVTAPLLEFGLTYGLAALVDSGSARTRAGRPPPHAGAAITEART